MNLNLFLNDPLKDCSFDSSIPNVAKHESCMLGIDEAGRGPVLGPMLYAAAYFPINRSDRLSDMGFADSKTLNEDKREELFTKMGDKHVEDLGLGWCSTVLSPVTISNSMFKRSKYNLNELSHDTAISLINRAINSGIKVSEIYVDTVGPAEKYQNKLKNLFPKIKIKVSNKADSIYPIVSAASICAKVIRDRIIKSWKYPEKGLDHLDHIERGSGYPSDPTTKKFLEKSFDEVFGFPTIVRFSWSTAVKIIDERGIKCQWDDEESEDSPQNTSILEFFKRKSGDEHNLKAKKPKSNSFFTDMNLKAVVSLDSLK